jgi:tetratricopeptide (TPR) repeat protein
MYLERNARESDAPEIRRALTVGLIRMSDLRLRRGDPGAALFYCSRSLPIREELAARLNTPDARRDLSVNLIDMADICHAVGKPEESMSYLERALEIRLALNEGQETPDTLNDVGTVYMKMGYLRRPPDRELLQRAFDLYTELAERYPEIALFHQYRDMLSESLAEL